MPHTPEDKQRAITRLRRIKGQAEALERAVEAGSDCAPILQQLAAMRGAVHGLMADLLDSHVRETIFENRFMHVNEMVRLGARIAVDGHTAVVTGVLPLATATAAAVYLRQRPSNAFWVCAALGCTLVLAFAAHQGAVAGQLVRFALLLQLLDHQAQLAGLQRLGEPRRHRRMPAPQRQRPPPRRPCSHTPPRTLRRTCQHGRRW